MQGGNAWGHVLHPASASLAPLPAPSEMRCLMACDAECSDACSFSAMAPMKLGSASGRACLCVFAANGMWGAAAARWAGNEGVHRQVAAHARAAARIGHGGRPRVRCGCCAWPREGKGAQLGAHLQSPHNSGSARGTLRTARQPHPPCASSLAWRWCEYLLARLALVSSYRCVDSCAGRPCGGRVGSDVRGRVRVHCQARPHTPGTPCARPIVRTSMARKHVCARQAAAMPRARVAYAAGWWKVQDASQRARPAPPPHASGRPCAAPWLLQPHCHAPTAMPCPASAAPVGGGCPGGQRKLPPRNPTGPPAPPHAPAPWPRSACRASWPCWEVYLAACEGNGLQLLADTNGTMQQH